jgi:hypothetical protein
MSDHFIDERATIEHERDNAIAELHFLRWFYGACDFGPAHSDVIDMYREDYIAEFNLPIPDGYQEEE